MSASISLEAQKCADNYSLLPLQLTHVEGVCVRDRNSLPD